MPPTRMTEVSTIYQPQRQTTSALALDDNISPTPATLPTPEATNHESNPTPDTLRESPSTRRLRSEGHGRGFQFRQGSFKLNALRLPSTVARFVIMQVIFSCGCALLGILSVAFRCWMAYLCIPVVVGALELLIGIIGYTAIKRPHKRGLVQFYFVGCFFGSLAGLGLVIFSIIAAATEDEYECMLLPGVNAECNVVRGARFAIELTTVIVGVCVIVVTQVMFMIMCYGSCFRIQSDDPRARVRAPRSTPPEEIPANLELPPYDEHHNYPTSPFHEVPFFASTVSPTRFEPPSYTNIGLVNDEIPVGIMPLAAALGPAVLPTEPPPPYTLFAPTLQSTPNIARHNLSQSILGSGAQNTPAAIVTGGSTQAGSAAIGSDGTSRSFRGQPGADRDGRITSSFTAPHESGNPRRPSGWRDRTIHQSLRLNSEQSDERQSRSAHQRLFGENHQAQTESTVMSEEDPSIVPAELYRDQIRSSGHRYSLSDPTLQSRNARNRQSTHPPLSATHSQGQERTRVNGSDGSDEEEMELVLPSQRLTDNSQAPSTEDSPRRRQALPPPYEGRHNVVRTHSSMQSRPNSGGRYSNSRESESRNSESPRNNENFERNNDHFERNNQNFVRNGMPPVETQREVQGDIHQARTLPSNWRPELEGEDAIYESIPSPETSPSHVEQRVVSNRQRLRERAPARNSTNAAENRNRVRPEEENANVCRSGDRELEGGRTQWRDVDSGRVRSGSRSWDEGAYQQQRLPDVVGERQSARERPRHTADSELETESESRTLPVRQPPPYGGRRIPAYAPPPYRARNRSLPNYTRRPNLTSPPPPYQDHQRSQRNVNSEQSDRVRGSHREREVRESSEQSGPGRAVREMTELSDRVGYEQVSRGNEDEERPELDTVPSRGPVESAGLSEDEQYDGRSHTFRDAPQPVISHSLPRPSSSSLAITPPSSTLSRRISSPASSSHHPPPPSSSRQYPASPSSSSSSSVAALSVSTSSPSSSSNAISPRRARQDLIARIGAAPALSPPPSLTSSPPASFPSNGQQNVGRTNSSNTSFGSQYPRRPRPVVPVRSVASSLPHPKPVGPNTLTSPSSSQPQPLDQMTSAPLHPRSLPRATTPRTTIAAQQQQRTLAHSHDPHNSSKLEVSLRNRNEPKPAAEIHPFRTVRSTPVKAQRAYVATKALAHALQKGHLNDLLEEYEETII